MPSSDADGSLTSRTVGVDVTAYASDTLGRRTSTTSASGEVASFSWDQVGLLTGVEDSVTGSVTDFTYAGGLRIGAATTVGEDTSTEAYTWDTLAGVPVLLTDGTHEYIYGLGSAPVAQVDTVTGVVTFLHGDLVGSTRSATDASGVQVGSWDYSTFGVTTTATGGVNGDGAGVTRFLFAGEYLDDSGLYYLRARFYDPVTASFLSVDPALSVTGSPYAYAAGNPLQLVDPLGLSPWDNWTNSIKNTVKSLTNWENVGDIVGAVSCKVSGGFFGSMKSFYGGIASAGSWYWDRESTFLQYTAQANWRRIKNPLQTAWDVVTLTAFAEDMTGIYQVAFNDAELFNEGKYCGTEGECFTGGRTPDGSSVAITIGHNVTWGVNSGDIDAGFIEHEFQHVYDYENWGGIPFGIQYGGEYLVGKLNGLSDDEAYRNISFERRARGVAGDPDRDARGGYFGG